jgi:hypothetical protein
MKQWMREDPEPMFLIQIRVPVQAGEFVHEELLLAVGDEVHQFEQAIPNRAWDAAVRGHYPAAPAAADDAAP